MRIPRNPYLLISDKPNIEDNIYIVNLYICYEFIYLFRITRSLQESRAIGDKYPRITKLIDRVAFRPQLEDMYNNKTEKCGRP
jgi:hypothetical protein